MADDFNPYHVWLSIPPEEQPPNLYRLLGLRLFETSGDVIDGAADRQMAHLRTFQGGKHGDLTQRLLNAVAAARVCLLDGKKRAEYDQQLRAKLAAAAPAPAAQPAGQPAKPPVPLRRAAAQADAEKWDDLLGDSSARTPQNSGIKSAKSLQAVAKQDAKNRKNSVYIAAAVVLIVAAGIGFFVLNRKTDGTLVLDWPASDLTDVAISVDGAPIEVPATGPWEHNYRAGSHHFVAQRPAFKMTADITLAAGERMSISPDWKPKAMLTLNWPLADRASAELKIDGRPQTVSQSAPLEFPVEPGRHVVQISRPGTAPFNATPVVVEDQPAIIVVLTRPPKDARLVFDWPADQLRDAELTVDGRSETAGIGTGSNPLELTLKPGRHVVHITRAGFEPFNQAVDLVPGSNQSINPSWTPEQKKAPTVVETSIPVEAAPEPAKKLPIPAATEQEQIAKQLDDLYKTSWPGPKDPAKAQELYDVAAKAGGSPAERYMLLMKGAEIAAAAGDLNLSLQGIDTLDTDYEINALEAKQKLLDRFIAAGKPEQLVDAIPTAEQLVDQAVAADHFEIALALAMSASRAVAKSKMATRKQVDERLAHRRRDIRLLEPIHAAVEKAQETLEKNPADPEANLTVGRWLCFYKGDWTAGLPLLAKGSEEKLKALAEQEIKSPTEADQQVQIADAWWGLAQKEAGIARDSVHLHAGNIYQAAMPNLASALKKAAIEKRLAEIANVKPIVAAVAANNSTGAAKFPLNQWVDVLRLVDTTKNVVKGKWSRTGRSVVVEPGDAARLVIPVAVEGSYDLEVEFTRTSGEADVATLLSIGSQQFMVALSAFVGTASALDRLDGRNAYDPKNPTAVRPGRLENGHRYRLLVKVRAAPDAHGSVNVSLDGRPYLPHWEGSLATLALEEAWAMPDPRRLGLGAWQSRVTFSSVRLRLVSGHASADDSVLATATSDRPMRGEFSSDNASRPSRWMKEVAALPAEQQVEVVVKKLQQSNADFDGMEEHKIENGVVTELTLATDNVTDISAVRALIGLKKLKCAGSSPGKGSVTDLSPLRGMPLMFLDFGWTKVSDLSPLQGMPLIDLQCGSTPVSDLSPLKKMPLAFLDCGGTQVTDLSPLKGMPLNRLICDRMQVSDLSPLQGMPLKSLNCSQNQQLSDLLPLKGMSLTELFCNDTNISDLSPLKGMPLRRLYFDKTRVYDVSSLAGLALNEVAFTPQQIRAGLDVLRQMPSVKMLRRNAWDAASSPDEFWKKYDAGDLNK